jgi:site-specific DNA recombinase
MPGCRARRRRTRAATRTGPEAGWTLRTVAAIPANPRYTGRQVWNRQPSEAVLVDPANTSLGHRVIR